MKQVKKSVLYRMFGIAAVPRKLLPFLKQEDIVVSDEGMKGWFITKNVKAPGKRYHHRREGFLSWLVVTRERILCYTYWKRQINISIKDPKISELCFSVPNDETLSISFESSVFRDGWNGIIELRFQTEKALEFFNALQKTGAQQGVPADV